VKAVEGWETKRFDEFGTIYSGSTPSTAIRSFWDGDIVWVTPNDLSKLNTPYLSDSGKRITEKGLKGCSATLLPERSLVMSSRAPIGYVALPTVPFCTNQGCKTIKLKNAYDPEFTYYNVLFNIDKVKNLGEGTTFAEISKAALSTVELSFPTSNPEQTKIAEILSTVDRAIEQTEALIAKQQRIKTGLMQDLLTRGIDEHGNLRSEQTHQFKDSPLGRIPVEWEIDKFGSRIESSAFGPRFPASAYSENGNIAMLRTTDLDNDGNIAYSNMPLATLDMKAFRPHFLHQGDFLISRSGTVGIPSVFEGFDVPVIPGAFLIRFRFHRNLAKSSYWKYYFNWESGRHRIVSQSEGGVQKNLRGSAINQMIMAFPTIDEQNQVASIFIRFDEDILVQDQVLIKLHSLRTALMQDLLTGKKRVTALLKKEVSML